MGENFCEITVFKQYYFVSSDLADMKLNGHGPLTSYGKENARPRPTKSGERTHNATVVSFRDFNELVKHVQTSPEQRG